MGFVITWLIIIATLTFIFTLFSPRFLNYLLPIKWEFKRLYNFIIFVVLFLAGIFCLNLAMGSQASAKTSQKSTPQKVSISTTPTIVDTSNRDSEITAPDPTAQAGVVVAKVNEPTSAKTTKSSCPTSKRGCTDPTAKNYDPCATINNGTCKGSASSVPRT
jgi:hypothetical protein